MSLVQLQHADLENTSAIVGLNALVSVLMIGLTVSITVNIIFLIR